MHCPHRKFHGKKTFCHDAKKLHSKEGIRLNLCLDVFNRVQGHTIWYERECWGWQSRHSNPIDLIETILNDLLVGLGPVRSRGWNQNFTVQVKQKFSNMYGICQVREFYARTLSLTVSSPGSSELMSLRGFSREFADYPFSSGFACQTKQTGQLLHSTDLNA